ncbi:hypothetical protein AAG570_005551 [Ranatra chinensis]|uniref:Prominin-like protein n=1 Tax=Ranatra chinensis TaxID=642074 RepID=A0ABD0XXU8_9HEMI
MTNPTCSYNNSCGLTVSADPIYGKLIEFCYISQSYHLDRRPNANFFFADFFAIENEKVVVKGEWEELGFHYGWLVLIGGCSLLLGAAVPLGGLVFCCCRCAGRCGARTQPFDKRYDTCRRHFFAFLLSVITVLIMFGVVCTFVTNECMEEGAQNFPKNVRTSLRDFQLYLNNTKKEVNNLLVTNFGELDVVLNRLLHRSGEIVKNKLGEVSKAAVLSNLTTIVSGLRTIRTDLRNIDTLTRALQEDAMILEAALKEGRQTLLERLRMCRNERPCMEFLSRYNITSLSIEANFTQLLDRYLPQLPDVTSSLQNVSALLTDGIEKEVLKGKEQFDKIKYSIQKSVDRIIPEISKEIDKGGKTLKAKASDVTQVLDKIQDWVDRIPQPKVDQGEIVLRKFTNYRYDFGLVVSCLVLTVLSSLAFGLLCGYCGKRPDHYSDDCCDKGTASRFLMLGVWLMFLSCSFLIVVTVLFMVTGSVADRLVCQTLKNPQNSKTFDFVEDLFELKDLYDRDPPNNLSSILVECHKNASIYKTLGLDLGSISSKYAEQFNIPERVRQLANSIVLNADIVIITPEAQKQLRALAASPLNNIDLTVYTSVLNDKITSIDLLQMAAALNQTAMKLPPSQANVKSFLLTKAMYLEMHQERQVAVMGRLAGELHGNATLLSHHLRFNHSSLRQAVDTLLNALNQAQHTLNTKGPRIVQQLAGDFGREFGIHIDNYLERVEAEAYHSVGKCWPVSLAYNATVVAVCNNLIDPFNGFWLSVGWIVVLYIPALILAIKLASLYQKSDPYPGALTEAEYLYDTYADRDNIPLAK